MNGKEYNGSWDRSLSFNAVCGILAVPAALMVPISALCVPEEQVSGHNVITWRQCEPHPRVARTRLQARVG